MIVSNWKSDYNKPTHVVQTSSETSPNDSQLQSAMGCGICSTWKNSCSKWRHRPTITATLLGGRGNQVRLRLRGRYWCGGGYWCGDSISSALEPWDEDIGKVSGNVEMALKCKHQRFEVKLCRTHSPISDWLTLIVCDEASNAQLWWLGYQGDLIVWKRCRNVLICAPGIAGQSIGFWVQRSGALDMCHKGIKAACKKSH
jgi:hypothetical protein